MHRIVLLFCTLFAGLNLVAQNVHPDYIDGKIYLKLNDRTAFKIGDVDQIQSSGSPKILTALIDRYDIREVKLAFPLLNQFRTFQTTYEITFGKSADVALLLEDIKAWSEVEYVERVPLYKTVLTPNDPNQGNQWYLNTINATQAWDLHTGGNSVVAVVDDAVKITHQDLSANVWVNPGETPNNGIDDDNNGFVDDVNGWDAADNDNNPNPPASATNFSFTHGTHVAGIVSASTDNGIGMAAIGFDTKIMAIKATYDTASNTAVIHAGLLGVQYAIAAGADVISMSWGGPGFSNTANNIMNQAFNLGITLVAAAGNDNVSSQFYPAAYTNVIAVASTAQSDAKSSFSNYGSWITVSAPGSGIYSTLAGSNSSYGNQSGTSMACPMVSGLIGLMKSYSPSSTPTDLRNCIVSSADDIDAQNPSYIGQLGGGRINAFAALQCINPNVAPNADFAADKQAGCSGFSVQFTDQSSGNPTSWSWSFPGGTPASSTQENPSITYNTPGTYNVSLTATNGFGSGSETKNGFITVLSSGLALPFTEDFESGGFTANNWTLDNPDNDYTWEIATVSGTSPGDKAAKMDFYFYDAVGQRDGLITPPLNFNGLSSAQLTFDHAYRRFNTNSSDSLIILVSTDCGATFPNRVFAGGKMEPEVLPRPARVPALLRRALQMTGVQDR